MITSMQERQEVMVQDEILFLEELERKTALIEEKRSRNLEKEDNLGRVKEMITTREVRMQALQEKIVETDAAVGRALAEGSLMTDRTREVCRRMFTEIAQIIDRECTIVMFI